MRNQNPGGMEVIREPVVAGKFYPEDPIQLENIILKFLKNADVEGENPPKVVVAPHAGYIYSGQIAGYSFKTLESLKGKNPTVFLLGPSHFVPFEGVSTGEFSAWKTPLGIVKVDMERVKKILGLSYPFYSFSEPLIPEHSLEVEIPFLQVVLGEFKMVPLVFGTVEPKIVSEKLLRVIKSDDVIVVSTDLSHYYPDEIAREIDRETVEIALKNDAEGLIKREACGVIPWTTLAYISRFKGWKPKLLAYGTSADTFGDTYSVVGYASLRYDE